MVSPVYMNVLSVSNSLLSLGAFQYSFNKSKSFANGNFTTFYFPSITKFQLSGAGVWF